MTRKEIKEWGQHIADKVFHGRHSEVKVNGFVEVLSKKWNLYIEGEELCKTFEGAGFEDGDRVEIIIRKV